MWLNKAKKAEEKKIFRVLEKKKAETKRYLQLQVFRKQSLFYSAQGHSRCAVFEFQTERNFKTL